MKYILSILLCVILQTGFSQIIKTVGISYTNGTPTYTPAKAGSALALDTVTWRYYTWNGSTWLSDGFRVQTISGCSAPAYTPTKYQSLVVINACNDAQGGPEIYKWSGSVWEKSGGTEYTAGTGIDITGGVISATATGGPDSTFAKTNGTYANKRISDNVYKNGTVGIKTTDTTAILNIRTDANALSADQKNVIHISHAPSSLTDNPERSHVWSIYDPNGLAGNIPTDKKFGRWYDYTTYSPDLNTPADPADTTGDMVHIMGYNLGRSDNNLRGSTWLQFEQDFNQPGSPHALKDLMEFHLNHLFLDGTGFRSINANATTDGKFIESGLGGDVINIQPARGAITPILNWDNRTRYLAIYDTTEIYFANNLPGAIVEKYKTSTTNPMNILTQNADNSILVGDSWGVRVKDTLDIKYAGTQEGGKFTAIGANQLKLSAGFTLQTSATRFLSFAKTGIVSPTDWNMSIDGSDTWYFAKGVNPFFQAFKNAATDLFTLRDQSVSVGQSYSIPSRFSVFQNADNVGGGIALANVGASRIAKLFTASDGLHLVGGGSTNDMILIDGKITMGNSTGVSTAINAGKTSTPEGATTGSPGDIVTSAISSVGDLWIKDSGSATNTGWLKVVKNQSTAAVSIGTSSAPNSSAQLDIVSTTKGFLPPRMTQAQRDAISGPATALTLYCTDCTATDASTGVMQTYNGTTWKNNW